MMRWEKRELKGNVAAYAVFAESVGAACTTANTVASAIAGIAATAVPTIAEAAYLAAHNAAKEGVDILLSPLSTGLYFLMVYPKKLDWQRAKLKETIAKVDATVETLKNQRQPGAFRRGFSQGADERLLGTSLTQIDSDLADVETELKAMSNNSLEETIEKLSAAQTQLMIKEYMMADEGVPTTFTYSDFLERVESSFDDPLDPRRPQLADTTVCGGAAIMVYADGLKDFYDALNAFAQFFKMPKLDRETRAISKFFAGKKRLEITKRGGMGRFPDWWSVSIARLLGVESEIEKVRKAAYNIGVDATIPQKYAKFLAYAGETLASSVKATTDLATLISRIANLNAGVAVLPIAPVDGDKTIKILGTSYTVPNATYGKDGFMRVLKSAPGAPTAKFVAGFVILVPSPLTGLESLLPGLDNVSFLDIDTLYSRIGSGRVDQLIALTRAAVTACQVQLAPIKTFTNAV